MSQWMGKYSLTYIFSFFLKKRSEKKLFAHYLYRCFLKKGDFMDNFINYINLARDTLKDHPRHFGGCQFLHCMATFSILINYGYTDSTLLKAALVHDLIEDVEGFDVNLIRNMDEEGEKVLELVLEVTKKPGQKKDDFLIGILKNNSYQARLLKCADRISNMLDLGYVSNPKFIERYCEETELFVMPMALSINAYSIYKELLDLCISRRKFLV